MSTTNWGNVERAIVARAKLLIPETIRAAKLATSEAAADKATGSFARVAIIRNPTGILNPSKLSVGRLGELVQISWTVIVYGSTGLSDEDSRYSTDVVATAVRDKLLGHEPAGQVDNTFHLILRSESSPEPFGSTGAQKLRMDFSLDQLMTADVT